MPLEFTNTPMSYAKIILIIHSFSGIQTQHIIHLIKKIITGEESMLLTTPKKQLITNKTTPNIKELIRIKKSVFVLI